jgi:hypothetical protein
MFFIIFMIFPLWRWCRRRSAANKSPRRGHKKLFRHLLVVGGRLQAGRHVFLRRSVVLLLRGEELIGLAGFCASDGSGGLQYLQATSTGSTSFFGALYGILGGRVSIRVQPGHL